MEANERKLRKCLRCLWKWFQRKPGMPRICPKCKTPYWNVPKKTKGKGETNGREKICN